MTEKEKSDKKTWEEEFEIASSELVQTVKELLREGNIRRIIIRNEKDDILLEIPLIPGIVVGSVVTAFAPVLAAVGALAALLARVKLQVVRVKQESEEEKEEKKKK
jgi:hypothetical protein